LFQVVRAFSSIMERMDRRLKASEEMYEKLSGTVESLRLEVKNLSTPIENSANPITQPTMKTADSFVSQNFFRNTSVIFE